MSEKIRIAKQTQKILQALRDAGEDGMTNVELSEIGLRYGGNLGILYQKGYKISKKGLGNGVYRYVLLSEPDTLVTREKALDKLLAGVESMGLVDKDELVELLNSFNISVKYKANTYNN